MLCNCLGCENCELTTKADDKENAAILKTKVSSTRKKVRRVDTVEPLIKKYTIASEILKTHQTAIEFMSNSKLSLRSETKPDCANNLYCRDGSTSSSGRKTPRARSDIKLNLLKKLSL